MKLSYREKIGLLVVTVVAIIVIFIAAPIKMIKQDIEEHQTKHDTVKETYDKNLRYIEEIPNIEKAIDKIYNESTGYSEIFFDHTENFEVDQYLSKVLNTAEFEKVVRELNTMEVNGTYTIEDAADEDLEFYCYKPDVVTYPILEAADINGNLMETEDKALYDKVINAVKIDELAEQKVEVHKVSVEFKFTKPALMSYIDQIKKIDPGVRITSLSIEDPWFGILSDEPKDYGYSKGNVSFCFYTMQKIAKPDFSK